MLAALPAGQICLEAGKKAAVCVATAYAIAAALPYSTHFAFVTITHLAFVVAFTEGVLSVIADLLDCPNYAVKKTIEGIETLGASALLVVATLALVR